MCIFTNFYATWSLDFSGTSHSFPTKFGWHEAGIEYYCRKCFICFSNEQLLKYRPRNRPCFANFTKIPPQDVSNKHSFHHRSQEQRHVFYAQTCRADRKIFFWILISISITFHTTLQWVDFVIVVYERPKPKSKTNDTIRVLYACETIKQRQASTVPTVLRSTLFWNISHANGTWFVKVRENKPHFLKQSPPGSKQIP